MNHDRLCVVKSHMMNIRLENKDFGLSLRKQTAIPDQYVVAEIPRDHYYHLYLVEVITFIYYMWRCQASLCNTSWDVVQCGAHVPRCLTT